MCRTSSAGAAGSDPVFGNVGNTDQRSKIGTFNIAPTYTRTIGANSVFNFGPYVRKDQYNYYPSGNPLADLGPANLQTQSIAQNRTLTNAGVHTDYSYVKGINNIKIGARYEQTFLRENDSLGIVDPTYNSPCVDVNGNPLPGYSVSAAARVSDQPGLQSGPRPYDLTRGGSYFHFFGHTDVKELASVRRGPDQDRQLALQPRHPRRSLQRTHQGHVRRSRVSASPTPSSRPTPFSASPMRARWSRPSTKTLCSPARDARMMYFPRFSLCTPGVSGTLQPGYRNEFHAGLQQAFGKNLVISGDYIWKYTHNAFDFSVLGNTPITFPIDWHNSKIPGFALRVDVPNYHNLSAYVVMSSVAARFFPPQIAGAGATVGQSGYPFRIDHDERYNQTTHLQYQIPGKRSPWVGFNWRFDSGLIAGSVPCYNTDRIPTALRWHLTLPDGQPGIDLQRLTSDEQFEAGLTCNGVKATPTSGFSDLALRPDSPLSSCQIPAPNTENDDKNPPRIAPRNLFDASIGQDNLFHGDRYKWSLRLTGVNIPNKYALYNFLSTFSGTHYVTPRALTAELGFHF